MSIDKRTEMILKKEALTIFNQFCSKLPSESLGLLMMYLQKFNDDNPDNGTIVFTKKEYEKKLGNEEISIDEIQDGISGLLKPVSFKGEIRMMFSMFEGANVRKTNGEYFIYLTCSDIAKNCIFTNPDVAKCNLTEEVQKRIIALREEEEE
jgi:hypothetical protein